MIGQTLGHYRIVDKLGEGGMGVVYLAEDLTLGREVALKVLPPELAENPERLERFQREAKTLAALDHPNIVTIHSVESAAAGSAGAADSETVHFITMQRVEGKRVSELIPPGGMPLESIFEIAIPLADALATAHAKGIIHRDLKPGNVMVGPRGQVKVLDFGLAKLRDQASAPMATELPTEPLTGEGRILGTVPYMSPEQLEGKEIDGRTDVFSLGVMLYEMATGERPFQGTNSASLILSIGRDIPNTVDTLRQDLPHHLGRVIGRCLEKDPELRYQTVKDVRNELTGLQRETDSREHTASGDIGATVRQAARPASSPAAASAPTSGRGRSRTVIGILIVLVAVVGAFTAFLLWRERPDPESATTGKAPASSLVRAVAVFPFSNLSDRPELDFLALALPDEVTTVLAYGHGLEVRPFSLTRKYQGPGVDPQAAGREVRATDAVTGQYAVEGDRLQVTLEAVDVAANSLVWRQRLSVAADDPLALREAVAVTVRQALLPALGGSSSGETLVAASNPEAYRLFLESLAISRDPEPNRQAIEVLEQVVELDPGFAPAWSALSDRYGYEGYYGGGSTADQRAAMASAESAARRALELDPTDLGAGSNLTFRALESGRAGEAYAIAKQVLAQNPERASAHFMMSYLYRYVGLLDDAARECNTALALSPTDYGLRSCIITFYRIGELDRARDFLALDAETLWAYRHEGLLHVFAGRLEEADRLIQRDPHVPFGPLLTHCLADPESDETRRALDTAIDVARTSPDPEIRYHVPALMAVCGFGDEALEVLPSVAAAGYCSPGLFDEGPFQSLRGLPGWEEVQAAHEACQVAFLEAKRKVDAGLRP